MRGSISSSSHTSFNHAFATSFGGNPMGLMCNKSNAVIHPQRKTPSITEQIVSKLNKLNIFKW